MATVKSISILLILCVAALAGRYWLAEGMSTVGMRKNTPSDERKRSLVAAAAHGKKKSFGNVIFSGTLRSAGTITVGRYWRVTAKVYSVDNGKVVKLAQSSGWDRSARRYRDTTETTRAHFVVVEFDDRDKEGQDWRRCNLFRKGFPQGSIILSDSYRRFAGKHKKVVTGLLRLHEEVPLYVEGDQAFEITPDMTVDEFAARNSGRFMLVSILAEP